jgi:myosin-7
MKAEEARKQAELLHQKRLAEMEAQEREEEETKKRQAQEKVAEAKRKAEMKNVKSSENEEPFEDSEVVDKMFDFLGDKESDRSKIDDSEFIGTSVPTAEEEEDISEYKFSKFAATYFQGHIHQHYSKKRLKHPILALKHEIDQLV